MEPIEQRRLDEAIGQFEKAIELGRKLFPVVRQAHLDEEPSRASPNGGQRGELGAPAVELPGLARGGVAMSVARAELR